MAKDSGKRLTKKQEAAAAKKLAEEKRAGKSVAEPEDESDADSADEPAPSKKAKTSKGKAVAVDRDREKKPSADELYDHLLNGVAWAPTRFADVPTMRELGLYDDIEAMLSHLKMPKLQTMAHPTYKDVSCQFLSTLFVTKHTSRHAKEGWGKIAFKVNGRSYTMSFREIGRVMGFDDQLYSFPEKQDELPSMLWNVISGNQRRQTGRNKNTQIRHPSVRYLHRMLVHAFYPRKEIGTVTDEDLYLLFPAIQPYTTQSQLPYSPDIYSEVGWVNFLVDRFRYYRDWAWETYDTSPKIGIGGLITPLLEHKGISLGKDIKGPDFMDAHYLRSAQYFSGMYEESYVYHFVYKGNKAELLLPNRELTRLDGPSGISFNIPAEAYLGEHGSLRPIGTSTQNRPEQRHTEPEDDIAEAGDAEPVYGQPRYTFTPYSGTLPPGALRDAHDHIRLLQKWNKAQDRTIEKLKLKCKILSQTVKQQAKSTSKILKKMADVLTRGAIAGCSRADFEFPEAPRTRLPSHPTAPGTALGPPLTERQRKRLLRNPPIQPSASGNKSPSLASSDDGIEAEEVQSQRSAPGSYYTFHPEGYYTYHPPDDADAGASASTRYP